MGRQNKTTSPGGTINKTFYDVRNLVTETMVGTVDGGGSDNMLTVVKNEYDGGSDGGDGNLTKATSPVDANTSHDRISEYEYDWRDRQTAAIVVESSTRKFRTERMFDNLGRATQEQERRADISGSTTTTTLIAQSATHYDDRGRVYRTERWGVEGDGDLNSNILADNTWYDAVDNVLKVQSSGSDAFTKTKYDAIGRTTASHTGYWSGTGNDAPDNVDDDVIFEESLTTYDAASNVTFTISKQRWHDATGNGELNGPSGNQPKSRNSYAAYWYDGIGRQIQTADYGTNGQSIPTRDSAPSDVTNNYPDALVSTVEHYPAGKVKDDTNPKGQVTQSVYDDAGRVTKVTQNHGSTPNEVTRTEYTVDGKVAKLIAESPAPPTGTGDQETVYTYGVTLTNSRINSKDLLHTVTYPDSGVVTYEYNRQGQRIKMTDQNGTLHEYNYDLLGRYTEDKVTLAQNSSVDDSIARIAWSYDNRMRLECVTSYDGATPEATINDVQYAYNDFSQIITEYQQHGGAVVTGSSPEVQYGYANGADNTIRRKSITYPTTSKVFNYSYGSGANDKLSRVEKLQLGSADIVEYEYLGLGQVVIQKYSETANAPPASDKVEYTLLTGGTSTNPYVGLDEFGRIINLKWQHGSDDLVHLEHGYDKAGNRLYRRDEVARNLSIPQAFDELYGYDNLNRLTSMNRGTLNVNNDAISGITLTQGWTLDSTGNWSAFDQSNATPAYQTTRTHNTANEVTGITTTSGSPTWDTPPTYDANGNMIEFPQPKSLGDSYKATWDAWNRLVKLEEKVLPNTFETVAEYEYDGLNRRTVKKKYVADVETEARHAYFSDQWQVLEERVDSAATADRQFVWGMRYVDDLVLRDKGSERLYALQDALFNVVALTDATGAVQQRFAYQSYGESEELNPNYTAYSGSTDYEWEYRFTGREFDLHTGLQINRRRYLHLQLGRWISADPQQYIDGMSLYRYASGNPIINGDPFGLVVPIIPIVIGASCAACWGVAGVFFNTAHDICKNSKDETSYLLCFITAIEEMNSNLDWYSWTVINAACLACGGGITGAARKIGEKMGAKWAKKKAAKEAAEKAAKEKAEKKAKKCALCKTLKKAKEEACDKSNGQSCTSRRGKCLPLSDEEFLRRSALFSACASARATYQKTCFKPDDPKAKGHWDQVTAQFAAATRCANCAYLG